MITFPLYMMSKIQSKNEKFTFLIYIFSGLMLNAAVLLFVQSDILIAQHNVW